MAKKVKHKAKVIVLVLIAYVLSCLGIGVVASLISVFAGLNSYFSLSKTSSIVARGALYPYIQLSKRTDSTFFLAWEKALEILVEAPNLAHNGKRLQKTYTDHTPLDPELISSIQQQYSLLLHEWATFQLLASRSRLATTLLSFTPYSSVQEELAENTQLLQATDAFLLFAANRINEGKPVHYLVLFQNNMELRPTGGFPGSYANIRLAKNEPITFEVQDIYVPDGQLQGHVDPPLPIQEAFQQGFWKLRDANWHPDFQESTTRIKWFFTEAGYPEYDGVIGINFTLVQKVLEITGPLKVADLNEMVSKDNVYRILQRTEDKEFFPGSTKKKDTLSAFTKQLIFKLQNVSVKQYFAIFKLVNQQLTEKNILVSVNDPNLNMFATLNHWDGKLYPVSCSDAGCAQDYFSVFESNMGVNKSNCCVKREITLVKESTAQTMISTSTLLKYQNLGPGTEFAEVAGHYKAFIRLYYPAETQLLPPVIDGKSYTEYVREMKSKGYFHPITSEGYSWGDEYGMKELGMWIEVEPEKELNISIQTITQLEPNQTYSLVVQKQSGILDQFAKLSVTLDNQLLFSNLLQTDLRIN